MLNVTPLEAGAQTLASAYAVQVTANTALNQQINTLNSQMSSLQAALQTLHGNLVLQASLCNLSYNATTSTDLNSLLSDSALLSTLLYPVLITPGMTIKQIVALFPSGSVIALPPGTFLAGTKAVDLHLCAGIIGFPGGGTKLVLDPHNTSLHGLYIDHSNFLAAYFDLDMTGGTPGTDGHAGAGIKVISSDFSHQLTGLRFVFVTVHDVINGGSGFQIYGADDVLLQDCAAYNVWAIGAWAVHVHGIYPDNCNRMWVLRFRVWGRMSGAFFKSAVSSAILQSCQITCDLSTVTSDDLGFWVYDGDTSAFNGATGPCSIEVYDSWFSNAAQGCMTVRAGCSLIALRNNLSLSPFGLVKQHGFVGFLNLDFLTGNIFNGIGTIKQK